MTPLLEFDVSLPNNNVCNMNDKKKKFHLSLKTSRFFQTIRAMYNTGMDSLSSFKFYSV